MSRDRRRWWRCCCPIHPSLLLPSFPSPFLSLSLPLAPCPAHRLKFKYCNVVLPGRPCTFPLISERASERPDANHRLTDSEERRNESCEPRLLIGQCRRRRRRAVPRGRREGRAQQSSRQSRAIPPSLPPSLARLRPFVLRNRFAAAVKFLSKVTPPFLLPRPRPLSHSPACVRRNSSYLWIRYSLLQGPDISFFDFIGVRLEAEY